LPLIVGLPIFMISMLSHQSNYYDYSAHYSAGLIIPILVSYIDGVVPARNYFYFICQKVKFLKILMPSERIDTFNLFLICWLLCFQIALGTSPISRLFWVDKVWSLGIRAYIPTERDLVIRDLIEKYIPPDDSVVVSSQNNINYLRLAMRQNFLIFPGGVTELHQLTNWDQKTFAGLLDFFQRQKNIDATAQLIFADYVLIDIKRPHFVYDVGCDTAYSKCLNEKIEMLYLESIKFLENKYTTVYEYDGFRIFKKNN
jgi:hypothetical protein